jgi:hypothetical protein
MFCKFPLVLPVKYPVLIYHLSAWGVGGLVPFMTDITHLRIKPLIFASDHGRYIVATLELKLVSVREWHGMAVTRSLHKFIIVSLLKRPFYF